MNIVKTVNSLVIAGVLVMMGMSGHVLAEDGKGYPGWMCQADANSLGSIEYLDNGGVANTHSTENLTVRCPIMRDNTGNSNGWKYAYAYFVDRHLTQRMRCTTGSWGDSVYSLGASTSWSKRGITSNRMSMSRIGGVSSLGDSSTFYLLTCELPPQTGFGKSVLYHYSLEEY